jgi:alpha-galactosidase
LRRLGEDLLDDLDDAVADGKFDDQPISKRLYELFEFFPSPGDRHVAEFVPHFLHAQSDQGRKYGQAPHDIRVVLKGREAHWEKLKAIAHGKRSASELLRGSSESAIDLMVARIEDRNALFPAGNVLNRGCIPNLPEDALVEVPILVGAHGISGIQTPPLPDAVAALTNVHVALHHMILDAAILGDVPTLRQAVAADPLVRDFDIIEPMVDEMLDAFEEHLPRYEEGGSLE